MANMDELRFVDDAQPAEQGGDQQTAAAAAEQEPAAATTAPATGTQSQAAVASQHGGAPPGLPGDAMGMLRAIMDRVTQLERRIPGDGNARPGPQPPRGLLRPESLPVPTTPVHREKERIPLSRLRGLEGCLTTMVQPTSTWVGNGVWSVSSQMNPGLLGY